MTGGITVRAVEGDWHTIFGTGGQSFKDKGPHATTSSECKLDMDSLTRPCLLVLLTRPRVDVRRFLKASMGL